MPNITFTLDSDLLRRAKVAAAQTDTSLNAVVRALLAGFVDSVGADDRALPETGNYRKLLNFSLGRITFRRVMSELNIDSDEQLFLLMCGAGLPMPTLSDEETSKMSETLEKVLVHASQ